MVPLDGTRMVEDTAAFTGGNECLLVYSAVVVCEVVMEVLPWIHEPGMAAGYQSGLGLGSVSGVLAATTYRAMWPIGCIGRSGVAAVLCSPDCWLWYLVLVWPGPHLGLDSIQTS